MYLYAIKELNTDQFFTKYNSLEPLGGSTLLFGNAEQPRRMIKYEDTEGFIREPVAKELTWYLLEKKYKLDRWQINPSTKEYYEIKDSLDLKVVKVCLIDLDEQESN